MAFKFKSSSREPMSEINVTPFVDVMLVLLIIFMVTAPLLTVGVQVDLPESSAFNYSQRIRSLCTAKRTSNGSTSSNRLAFVGTCRIRRTKKYKE